MSSESAPLLKNVNDEVVPIEDLELPIITRTNSFSMTTDLSPCELTQTIAPFADEPDPDWRNEMSAQLVLMGPIVLTYILEYLPGMVCIVLVGHLNSPNTKLFVDAATLSTMFTNVSALSVGFGLSSALDTLCSQAYGAGHSKKIGIYLQSGMIVIGACLLPIFLLNWHSEYFLLWAGQDPEVSRLAGQFSRYTVCGIPFLFLYEMIRKLMQAQNIVKPLVVIAVLGNLVNMVLGYYLAYHTSMGFYGAALSRTLGYIALPLCIIPYLVITLQYESWWCGWQWPRACRYIPMFLHLGVPGMMMMAMEWWAYEILSIMAGLLPNGIISMSAHAVCQNVASFTFMVYLGMGVSGNIRVGNALGANQPKRAQLTALLTMVMVVSVSCIVSAVVFLSRDAIPVWLVNDPEAINRASETLLILVPYEVIDATNCVLQGIFRGTGRQHLAARVNAVAFYVVGLPLASVLAFHLHFGVEGLWLGLGMGIFTSLLTCAWILSRTNWPQMANESQIRTAYH